MRTLIVLITVSFLLASRERMCSQATPCGVPDCQEVAGVWFVANAFPDVVRSSSFPAENAYRTLPLVRNWVTTSPDDAILGAYLGSWIDGLATGDHVTLEFTDNLLVNGDGVDLVVYELFAAEEVNLEFEGGRIVSVSTPAASIFMEVEEGFETTVNRYDIDLAAWGFAPGETVDWIRIVGNVGADIAVIGAKNSVPAPGFEGIGATNLVGITLQGNAFVDQVVSVEGTPIAVRLNPGGSGTSAVSYTDALTGPNLDTLVDEFTNPDQITVRFVDNWAVNHPGPDLVILELFQPDGGRVMINGRENSVQQIQLGDHVVASGWRVGVMRGELDLDDFDVPLGGRIDELTLIGGDLGSGLQPDFAVIAALHSEPRALNSPPVADAGTNQIVYLGAVVTLEGSGQDPDGDPLDFSWRIVSAPFGSTAEITDEASPVASFVPDRAGPYVFELTVRDPGGLEGRSRSEVLVLSPIDDAVEEIERAIDLIDDLGPGEITNRGNQRALLNFLRQALAAIEIGDIEEAIERLQHAIIRTDGCIVGSGVPDGNGPDQDWVLSCPAQAQIYPALAEALRLLLL